MTYQILYGEKNISLSIAHIDNIITFDKIEIEQIDYYLLLEGVKVFLMPLLSSSGFALLLVRIKT